MDMTLSMYARCLTDQCTSVLVKRDYRKIILHVEDICGVSSRRMTMVDLGARQYYADVRTGTLYDVVTGRCLSSTKRRIVAYRAKGKT